MRLRLATPKHRASLWILANVLWFSSIPAHLLYLTREARAGAFPPDGDTIAIPLFGWAAIVVLLAPILNVAWWWLSRGYPGTVRLLIRPEPSFGVHGVSVLLIGLAVLLAVGVIWEVLAGAPEMAVIVLSWCYLTLAYRAAYIAAEKHINVVAA